MCNSVIADFSTNVANDSDGDAAVRRYEQPDRRVISVSFNGRTDLLWVVANGQRHYVDHTQLIDIRRPYDHLATTRVGNGCRRVGVPVRFVRPLSRGRLVGQQGMRVHVVPAVGV